MKPMTPQELEPFVHRNLRALPPRRAPDTLEARVLAAIERRAWVPWYHRSWTYWPAPVRAVFLALAGGVSACAIATFFLLSRGAEVASLAAAVAERLAWIPKFFRVAQWIVALAGEMLAGIPPLWRYGGLAIIGLLYAAFFGLGAAAYRALRRDE